MPQNRERVFVIGHSRRCGRRKIFLEQGNDDKAYGLQGQTAYSNTITRRYAEAQSGGTYIIESEQQKKNDAMYTVDLKGVYLNSTRRGVIKKNRAPWLDCNCNIQPKIIEPTVCEQRSDEGLRFFKDNICGCLRTITDCGDKRVVIQDDNDLYSFRIRRLTPRECMRLQGVSDAITDKLIDAGISDTQMYRAAGDAMTVNVVYEIAKAINGEYDEKTGM